MNWHPDYAIVLAAGKGTRMGTDSCPKVCFEVNGIPAINRALAIYRACGIPQNVIVVGSLAGQVLETVGRVFPHSAFVYQPEQLGTAHALRCALEGLSTMDEQAVLLLVAGDRIIDQSVLEQLFDLFHTSGADLALLSLKCGPDSGQGRIVCDQKGDPLAVVEMADIRQRQVFRMFRALPPGEYSRKELRAQLCGAFFGEEATIKESKAEKAFGALWTELQKDGLISCKQLQELCPEEKIDFVFSGMPPLIPEDARHITAGNTSVYVVKRHMLQSALRNLKRDNAQQEEYLSDLIAHVRENGGTVKMLSVSDPAQVLGFNNPAELLQVEKLLRGDRTLSPPPPNEVIFRPFGEWLRLLDTPEFKQTLQEIYGNNPDIQTRQLEELRRVFACAATQFAPEERIGIVRSPGRLNVLGRHVDHQGGNCNLMTIGFETIMLVRPRSDDLVTLRHCDSARFKPCSFHIRELVADLPWQDWSAVVDSPKLAQMILEYGVDWSSYIKAAILRLQKKFPASPLWGMDLVIGGNLPMAAGLSSSSSLVVGAAEAAVELNRLNTFPAQLVSLCGEGEWFVGTRGGSADHAAVKMGREGSVVKVRFFDFAVEEVVPFPEDYAMVVCDSGIKARKSSNAKDQFNHRISCYRIGFKLIQKYCPQYRGVLKHLRDVNVKTLQIPLAGIYRILLMLPENATLDELQRMLPEEDIQALCAGHNPPEDGKYPIRGVVLFGLSEAARSAVYTEALKRGDIDFIGRMMKVSHDGDRVVSYDENWCRMPFHAPVDNAYLLERLSDLESGDPDRVIRSQLIWQSGAYACSIPEIDLLVDIAIRTPGVAGAQLAGAGLGGCMMVLVRKNAVDTLVENLKERYYRPAGIRENILVCRPIAGTGFIRPLLP